MPSPQPPPVCAWPWDPAVACRLETSYTFGRIGGFSDELQASELTPPSTYTLTRTIFGGTMPPVSCTNQLPRCGGSNETYTTADIVQALAAPDVVAALAQPEPLVYGEDDRLADGSVLSVRRADGRGLDLGGPCRRIGICKRPLTEGMARLAAILGKIASQQRALPGCEALRSLPSR
jgi:hypothetical protein